MRSAHLDFARCRNGIKLRVWWLDPSICSPLSKQGGTFQGEKIRSQPLLP